MKTNIVEELHFDAWLGRDKDGWLTIFENQPKERNGMNIGANHFYLGREAIPAFREVVFENGPAEIEITIRLK